MNWCMILAKSLIKDYYKSDKQRQFHTPNILERPKVNMTAIRIRPPGQLSKKPIRMGIGPGEPPNGLGR